MPRRVETVPYADDLLRRLADLLLAALPDAAAGHLADALVLLPSARACRDLGERLLDRAGGEALLLPRILTDGQWVDERAAVLGLDDADLPDDRVRTVALAHRLEEAPWLQGATAAPGLAEAYVAFFDEARRHGVDARLLRDGDLAPLLARVGAAEAESLHDEVTRLREVWRLYRAAVPRDRLDREVEAVARLAAGEGWPPEAPALVVVAGFGRLDPLRARLLQATLDRGRDHRLLVPAADHALDRRLLATWGAPEHETDPLAAARQQRVALGAPAPPVDPHATRPLAERLAATPAPPAPRPRLVAADHPEDEARAVASVVADWLAAHGAPARGVTVATADPRLAARIAAQLRDAGLDADNTVGEPLAALPAGLLLRFLLRAALTGLRAEPLLEVLGHPYTRLAAGAAGHGAWALRLERMFRLETGPQTGLAALHRRARERDAAAVALFRRQGPGMEDFVARVAEAFAPLLALADGRPRPWAAQLDALADTWAALAPGRPLAEQRERPDLTAAARLLQSLRGQADRLPAVPLAAFAAALGRLLAGDTVVPHRPRTIPLVVTGLVEARLARGDLLVLAGMNEGVFPGAGGTPVVMPGPARRRLGLPTWREARARDAELFLRLLHGAPEVVLTWSERRDGQPALPSPLVQRLRLALDGAAPEPADTVPRRREAPPLAAVAAARDAFAAEPAAIARHADARPLRALSWSMLRTWRDCPYRALLERGFALRAEEEVREEFGRREYGRVVHAVLCEALDPSHAVHAALADGDRPGAEAALAALGRDRFLPGSDALPERRLWSDAFATLVPALVDVEAARFPRWRPVAREAAFVLPLDALLPWCGDGAALPDHAREVVLRGVIDRVDAAVGGDALAVVDYKTGTLPAARAVHEGEDLQLALYALAVACGAVPGCGTGVTAGFFYGLVPGKVGPGLSGKGEPPLVHVPGEADGALAAAARRLRDLAVAASDPAATHPLLPRHAAGETTGPLPCRWCEHRGVCRVEERVPTPALAARLDRLVNAREVNG